MLLDKGLILKGLAGVAAVGGIATTGIALKEGTALNKLLFSSSKPKENDDQAKEVKHDLGEDQDAGETRTTGDQDVTEVTDSSTTESKEDAYGIPKRCNDSSETPCDLTQDELKKIKFEVLGDEKTPDVTVDNFPTGEDQKISLTIDSIDKTKKKYIFSNSSGEDVTIKKGEDKTVTLKSGKTKFSLNDKKLKEKELGDYGEPKDCTQSCTLTSTDLEDINFKDLEEGTGATTVSPDAGTVSLVIKTVDTTKRYIFSSSSRDVTIKKGNANTVTLTSAKKTQFTGSDNKLSKLALGDYGIPTSCTSTCTLTADDLGEIKFEELDGGTGTVSPTKGTISLKVDSTNKRFTFDNSSSSPITIKKDGDSVPTVTLSGGKNRFKDNDGKLKEIKLNTYGLPQDCNSYCILTEDDLKEVKFPGFEAQSGESKVEGLNNGTITLTITSDDYSFGDDQDRTVTITRGSASVTLKPSTGTYFHPENGKLAEGQKKSEAEKFNEMLKAAGFPIEENCVGGSGCCKFEKGKTSQPINCTLNKDKFTKLKFKNLGDGEMKEEQIPTDLSSTAKIEKDGADLKITFSGVNSISVDKKTTSWAETIYVNKNSVFFINSDNRIEKKRSSGK